MNFLNIFEERVSSIFDTTARAMPFSFKKLAKRAAHEMENETFVINGTDTAPALYTVLVSSADDQALRPVMGELTRETSQFLEAQAQKRGYVFVGQPLVRFMVDPSLKDGRFSVFAENVDRNTLERLRDEEARFMGSHAQGGLGGAAAPPVERARVTRPPKPVSGLDVIPDDLGMVPEMPQTRLRVPPIDTDDFANGQGLPDDDPYGTGQLPVMPEDLVPTHAMLIDRQSGKTYVIQGQRAIVGRERTSGGIILRDPNVSRRHAELDFDGAHWIVSDLNSTNGTLVNDVDVDECTLHDGDVITLGLTNLEFREG